MIKRWMAIFSYLFFFRGKIKLIGITGTSGKGTVAYLVHQILKFNNIKSGLTGSVYYFDGDIYSELSYSTTPEFQVFLPFMKKCIYNKLNYIIMEIGSESIKSRRLMGLKFYMKVLTNLKSDHLDVHKSLFNYHKTKLDFLNSGSCKKLSAYNSQMLGSSVKLIDVDYSLINTSFLKTKFVYRNVLFESKMIGAFNIANMILAINICEALGLTINQIKNALKKVDGLPGRFEIVSLKPLVIVDYAQNADALINVFESIKKISTKKIIHVFGRPGDRVQSDRRVFGTISEKYASKSIITNDNPRSESQEKIAEQIITGFKKRPEIIFDRRIAIKHALKYCDNKSLVLVTGMGSDRGQKIGNEVLNYQDKEYILSVLNNE